MRVNIGDVVLAEYRSFEGELRTGLFVVIYHDCEDSKISTNFTALKISTKPYLYQVAIEKNYAPFLEHDSYVNCNNLFRFKENQVEVIIGKMSVYYKNRILQQTISYNNRVVEKLVESIGIENVFENILEEVR